MRFRIITTAAALAGMALIFAPSPARAGDVDFSCSLGIHNHCTGTVVKSGANYSTTGISLFNDSGPYSATVPFTLTFNTATGAISIDGTGVDLGQNLIGTITSFSASSGKTTQDLSFTTFWPTLPLAVQTQLGTKMGTDSGFVISVLKTRRAESADVLITPLPEPASLLLLGTGLLGLAGIVRRRIGV